MYFYVIPSFSPLKLGTRASLRHESVTTFKGRATGRIGSGFSLVNHGSGRVGSGRVGSGRVGSGRVGSGRVGSGRVGSDRVGSGRVDPTFRRVQLCSINLCHYSLSLLQ